MPLNILTKTFPFGAGNKVYAGVARPSSGGGGETGNDVSWVPPPGFFSDVPMTNMAQDVGPSFYSLGKMNDPFVQYGGSAFNPDYSVLGAQVYCSSGHVSYPGEPNVQIALVCDFSSLTWAATNRPSQANAENDPLFDPSTMTYADGSMTTPHTYTGLLHYPAAWGGGSKGSLLQCFWAGAAQGPEETRRITNRINVRDLSQSVGGYSTFVTTQPENSQPSKISFGPDGTISSGVYPMGAEDYQKQGWWLNTQGVSSYTLFLSKTGTITQYAALGGNNQDPGFFLADTLNLAITVDGGYISGDYVANPPTAKRLYVLNTVTGVRTTASTVGGEILSLGAGYDGPDANYFAPKNMGMHWVAELGAAYGFDYNNDTGVCRIAKLTPPASSPETGVWTWSIAPVNFWADGPTQNAYPTLRQPPSGGMLSKFKWAPTLHAFTCCVGSNVRPQVITPPVP